MSILEIRSTITFRTLLNKSKSELAHLVLDLLNELHQANAERLPKEVAE